MGRSEVEPGAQGTVRTSFGDYEPECSVTAWEPLRRLAYRSDADADGRFVAYEFLIEGRGRGSTVLRTVTSGFLPGDYWEAEYHAMTLGGELFFHTLVEYLTHFAGRTATPITAFGPPVHDWDRAWSVLHDALGLTGPVHAGDRAHMEARGLPPVDGVVYFRNADTLGVRTDDALYRFLRGLAGPMVVGHHLFSDAVDQREATRAWQTWLTLHST
jgi:hypothetical protein